MTLSIIIVNYKTFDLTLQTIQSVLDKNSETDMELIVIDNFSANGDAEKLQNLMTTAKGKLQVVLNQENRGFSKANNQGIQMASGKYIALLNSDTLLTTDSLDRAIHYLEQDPGIGAVGCRLITPDGKLDHGCKRGFPTPEASFFYFLGLNKFLKNPRYDAYMLSRLDEHAIHDVDVISGAFMVMPRRVLDEVGLLDERFFMYGEDIDLCYRIKQAGCRIVYNPELGNVVHYKGSSGKKRRIKTIYNFCEAMILFYNKHYRTRYNCFVTAGVYAGIAALFCIKLLKNIWAGKAPCDTISHLVQC